MVRRQKFFTVLWKEKNHPDIGSSLIAMQPTPSYRTTPRRWWMENMKRGGSHRPLLIKYLSQLICGENIRRYDMSLGS